MKRVFLILIMMLGVFALFAAPEYPQRGPDIYDTKANGEGLIADAVQKANLENKRVILDFGANWCPWCHKLHSTFTEDPAVVKEIDENYLLVMIDVNEKKGPNRNAEIVKHYDNPTKEGVPVLVVLDRHGKRLTTQETGALEDGDHHSPEKVLAFLKKWDLASGTK